MAGWPLRLMIYGGGEAIDGSGALALPIQEQLNALLKVCTNRYVAALAQLDASSSPSKRLVLDPGGQQPVLSLPNVDIGDPDNLIDFVEWCEATCPAERTVMVLSGHGVAWQDSQADAVLGAAPSATRFAGSRSRTPDALHHPRALFGRRALRTRAILLDGGSRDYLSNAELGSVCEQVAARRGRSTDVLVLDACLMSAWELLIELSASVSAVVASIDELSSSGIDMAAPAAELTGLKGEVAAQGIAAAFAEHFVPKADFDSCVAVDLTAAAWTTALSAFTACCAALLPWIKADARNARDVLGALDAASRSLVQYRSGGIADVAALTDALIKIDNVPATVVQNARVTIEALQSCVVARSTGRDYNAALGLSIFAPSSHFVFANNRADYSRLRFPAQTGWIAVLDTLFST